MCWATIFSSGSEELEHEKNISMQSSKPDLRCFHMLLIIYISILLGTFFWNTSWYIFSLESIWRVFNVANLRWSTSGTAKLSYSQQNFNFSYSSKILNSFSNTFNQGKTFFLVAKFFNHGKTFLLAVKFFPQQNILSLGKTFILAAKLSYSFNFWKHGKIFRALTLFWTGSGRTLYWTGGGQKSPPC